MESRATPQERVRRLLSELQQLLNEMTMQSLPPDQIENLHALWDLLGHQCAKYLTGKCAWDASRARTIERSIANAFCVDPETGDRYPMTVQETIIESGPDVMSVA